jgi:hypothetical protein
VKARANSITFAWATAWTPNSVYYRIEITDLPSFAQLLVDSTIDGNSISLPKSYFAVDVQYYWRVKAFRVDPNLPDDSTDYSSGVFTVGGGCCMPPIRGNIDYDAKDNIDISDLVYLVDYMFNGGPAPPCWSECNVDAVGPDEATGIDISDLVYLVDYMFTGGPAPGPCP